MKTKSMIITAACIAIGVVLPQAFHAIPQAGAIFLPMHLPVLICGFACAWPYAIACGILTPLLSSLLFSMPAVAILPSMMAELVVYAVLAWAMMRLLRKIPFTGRIYTALVLAMLGGRVVYGALNALIFRAGAYSMELWLTASFVKAAPGIVIQLVLVPIVVLALRRAKLIDFAS